MIELFTHGTANGHKIAIALEELELPYQVKPVNVFAGEGQQPWFLKVSPAGKIPAIRDTDNGQTVFESNAILLYLAEKAGKLFPRDPSERSRAFQLLFLQASLQGPMFGQRAHFNYFAPETVPYGIRRYDEQGEVVYALMDGLLRGRTYFLDSGISMVDIAFFPWMSAMVKLGFPFEQHVALHSWFERVAARPAAIKGLQIPTGIQNLPPRKQL
jgi:GSH-dependent disulfide-bond oxidoreductase